MEFMYASVTMRPALVIVICRELRLSNVNDNGFPLLGDSAVEFVSSAAALAGSTLDSFAAHLMHCSLAPHKTSFLFGLRGEAQRSIFHNSNAFHISNKQVFLKFHCNVVGNALPPCVKHYKHLGKYNTCSITPAVDIANHVTAVHGQFGQLSREVRGNKTFPIDLKAKFAQIPVSKLLTTAKFGMTLQITVFVPLTPCTIE